MKPFLLSVSFLGLITCNYYAISSERSYNFDERLPGRQLLAAAIKGDEERAEQLLKDGSSLINYLDFYGRTPLHMALANNHCKFATYLIQQGASANIQDQSGRTPLMAAVYLPNDPVQTLRVCRSLKRRGASFDVLSKNGKNALMLASDKWVYNKASYKKLFLFLIKNTTNLDQTSADGKTALHYAAVSNRQGFKLLLDTKIDVGIRDKEGKTAHEVATFYHPKEVKKRY